MIILLFVKMLNKLKDPPKDSISCLRFAPSSSYLIASSWDSVCFSANLLVDCQFIFFTVIGLRSIL